MDERKTDDIDLIAAGVGLVLAGTGAVRTLAIGEWRGVATSAILFLVWYLMRRGDGDGSWFVTFVVTVGLALILWFSPGIEAVTGLVLFDVGMILVCAYIT